MSRMELIQKPIFALGRGISIFCGVQRIFSAASKTNLCDISPLIEQETLMELRCAHWIFVLRRAEDDQMHRAEGVEVLGTERMAA